MQKKRFDINNKTVVQSVVFMAKFKNAQYTSTAGYSAIDKLCVNLQQRKQSSGYRKPQ